jgi:hypothetical protein
MNRSPNRPDRHKRKTVSFRLPEKLMKQLRLLAQRNRRTLSGEAEVALENHLNSNGVPYAADG